MLSAKRLADLITEVRLLLGGMLAWLGLAQGAAGLPLAVWLMIADWTGDCLDGAVARRSRVHDHTWVGDHDLEADMLVSGGLLAYLVFARFLDLHLAGAYLLIWALVFWYWGLLRSLGMLFQAPIYAWFIWVAVRDAPGAGWWIVIWIAAAIVITWPKFPKEVIPGFLAGMQRVWSRLHRAPR
ncbi:MAG TPA: hypothetical protein VI793_16870 [Anaerolineales bacterium]|nr:hypothetical protein [Anaerolineales bacterium]